MGMRAWCWKEEESSHHCSQASQNSQALCCSSEPGLRRLCKKSGFCRCVYQDGEKDCHSIWIFRSIWGSHRTHWESIFHSKKPSCHQHACDMNEWVLFLWCVHQVVNRVDSESQLLEFCVEIFFELFMSLARPIEWFVKFHGIRWILHGSEASYLTPKDSMFNCTVEEGCFNVKLRHFLIISCSKRI